MDQNNKVIMKAMDYINFVQLDIDKNRTKF
jgi:hypothetical protein